MCSRHHHLITRAISLVAAGDDVYRTFQANTLNNEAKYFLWEAIIYLYPHRDDPFFRPWIDEPTLWIINAAMNWDTNNVPNRSVTPTMKEMGQGRVILTPRFGNVLRVWLPLEIVGAGSILSQISGCLGREIVVSSASSVCVKCTMLLRGKWYSLSLSLWPWPICLHGKSKLMKVSLLGIAEMTLLMWASRAPFSLRLLVYFLKWFKLFLCKCCSTSIQKCIGQIAINDVHCLAPYTNFKSVSKTFENE